MLDSRPLRSASRDPAFLSFSVLRKLPTFKPFIINIVTEIAPGSAHKGAKSRSSSWWESEARRSRSQIRPIFSRIGELTPFECSHYLASQRLDPICDRK